MLNQVELTSRKNIESILIMFILDLVQIKSC